MALTNFTIIKNPKTGKTNNLKYVLGWNKGSDSNGGSIDSPNATIGQAYGSSGFESCIVIRGAVSGDYMYANGNSSRYFVGEQDGEIDGNIENGVYGSPAHYFLNLKIKRLSTNAGSVENCSFNTLKTVSATDIIRDFSVKNVFCNELLFGIGKKDGGDFENLTILSFKNYLNSQFNEIYNSIVAGVFDLYNYSNSWIYAPVFKNSLFIKELFRPQFNGIDIPIAWTTEKKWISDFKSGLYAYADKLTNENHRTYLKLCADELFGEGCIIYDQSSIKVFNNGTYTLNRENGNPALYISTKKDYVGWNRPALTVNFENVIQNIDENGNVLSEPADLMSNNNGIFANVNSDQLRNRVTGTNVISFSNGDGFSKLYADFISSAANGWYLGMWQNRNANNPIIPFDQIELELYDTVDQMSAYPKIAVPLNRDCEIYYHKTGTKAGNAVLFNDLADLGIETNVNLTEYGEWAVTNASAECVDLQGNANVESRKLLFRYVKPRLTLNRTQK